MYFSHIQATAQLVTGYDYKQPFISYLKSFFQKHKKFGATDRRTIGNYCFNYYRLGNALPALSFNDTLLLAQYAIENHVHPMLPPSENLSQRLASIEKLHPHFKFQNINKHQHLFSKHVNADEVISYQLTKPNVFIRINKSSHAKVINELKEKNISFLQTDINTLSFSNGDKLTQLQSFTNGLFEIQDYASQLCIADIKNNVGSWWDCCAGAGGKSLHFLQNNSDVKLLLTDVRPEILDEANMRLARNNLKNYNLKVHDATQPLSKMFDGIIVDAPCSGSGTWRRAPENYFHFDDMKLENFKKIQLNILKNAWQHLKPGGQLIYITCSMFATENENVVNEAKHFCKSLKSENIIDGGNIGADTMYRALFSKSL